MGWAGVVLQTTLYSTYVQPDVLLEKATDSIVQWLGHPLAVREVELARVQSPALPLIPRRLEMVLIPV